MESYVTRARVRADGIRASGAAVTIVRVQRTFIDVYSKRFANRRSTPNSLPSEQLAPLNPAAHFVFEQYPVPKSHGILLAHWHLLAQSKPQVPGAQSRMLTM